MKVKCVLLEGDWTEYKLGGIYEAEAAPSYGFKVKGFYTNNNLEVEGFETECKFEVYDD